ncbi:MAG: sel1 repeat family protein [Clostridia bacterium]|nr:sel1 repeat family protein [Clostridia bacterium]
MTNQTAIKNNTLNVFSSIKAIFSQNKKQDEVKFEKSDKNSLFTYAYALLNANSYSDMKKGAKVLQKAVSKNDIDAVLLLARNYYYGYGVKKNDKKAYKFWKKGVRLDSGESAYYCGLCFAKGIYVGKNRKKAEKYLSIADDLGFAFAKNAIADLNYCFS